MIKKYIKILDEFRAISGDGKLILFGSVLKGNSRFDSDIDIAIISNDRDFISKVEEVADRILFKYGKVVSLVRFSKEEFKEKKEPIIREIEKGLVFYEGS